MYRNAPGGMFLFFRRPPARNFDTLIAFLELDMSFVRGLLVLPNVIVIGQPRLRFGRMAAKV